MSAINLVKIFDFDVTCYTDLNDASDDIINNRLEQSCIAVAINPEKIVTAYEDKNTYNALNVADLRYLDGIGTVKLAQKRLGKTVNRIPGCELWQELMLKASSRKVPIYILGATSDVVNKTVTKLKTEYGANIVGYHDGFFDNDDDMINEILSCNPKILTVALGSPRQEIFMDKCKACGVNAFMMGVGGTYNVFTGNAKRAPKVWCDLGLEWLYRLLCEPSRIFRQFKLLKFISLAIRKKI
ncbi:WecB/TagA/CpsF family glycosyltransferase [Photobacterium sp. GSS17]|uniref:WecB/TagA/CpsF family glycosyltransferase n=1 Tax=Photobacterium TaxID=657 RepID=UPI002361D0AC|nr:WecB/TagA/CpsF family glycosyltransferase [Photobacterium sp. GSS17]